MIELIFTVVILGILASIAIVKLSETRDDALVSIEMVNYKSCIQDLQSNYTAIGNDGVVRNNMGVMVTGPDSCEKLNCFIIDGYGYGVDSNSTTIIKYPINSPKYCKDVYINVFDTPNPNMIFIKLRVNKVVY
jgi:type II secretory pathway pseudopilin PulG